MFLPNAKRLTISIHAPREGSDLHEKQTAPPWDISIHAPREGSDRWMSCLKRTRIISIHAPREGSDTSVLGWASTKRNFYPRSPRGERHPMD